ncbi:MAG TPA: hypothetical protein VMD98_13860 [Bryocella sp.]|nr:hypothetical protein [Bryocella sp.]
MSVPIKTECPKCHADRTMLDTSFGLPGHAGLQLQKDTGASINTNCAIAVRLVMCPRCHLLEMYHDVGLGKLS